MPFAIDCPAFPRQGWMGRGGERVGVQRCCIALPMPIVFQEMRFYILVFLILLLAGQHWALAPAPVDVCCESDETSSPDGCASSCPLCGCCLDRTPMELPEVCISPLILAPDALFPQSHYALLTPEPAEILHVPKSLLA